MQIPTKTKEKETYLYINGIKIPRGIRIGKHAELLPAKPSYNKTILDSFKDNDVTYGIALMFLPLVSSQLKVTCENSEQLARLSWNSLWDVGLLGALFDCESACNFQSNTSVSELKHDSRVKITNFHLRGLSKSVYELSAEETNWLESNFIHARSLFDFEEFMNAIHCLSTYRWHTHPSAQLAIIWSGIEGLFNIDSELVFRLSLYISRFLYPDDKREREVLFNKVKKLYRQRSAAVHGSTIKGDAREGVKDSASLLSKIIYEFIRSKNIPNTDDLAP